MDKIIDDMKTAITQLTVIQQEQTKQTDRLIESVSGLTKISLLAEQHAIEINHIHTKIDSLNEEINIRENKMQAEISKNSKELNNIGQGRLWKGLSIAIGTITVAFGYLYSDIQKVTKREEKNLIHRTKVEIFMKNTENFMNATKKTLDEINSNMKN